MLKIKDTYRYWLIILVAFSIPLSQYLNVRILLVSVVLTLFLGLNRFTLSNLFRDSWDILIYVSVLIFGLLYTTDLAQGLRVLETNFSFLAIPIIVTSLQLNSKQLNNLWLAFILGLLTASAICISFALFSFFQDHELGHFLTTTLPVRLVSIPTHFAYYLSFCNLFITVFSVLKPIGDIQASDNSGYLFYVLYVNANCRLNSLYRNIIYLILFHS
ncbi:MAG: hypothetical protein U5K54_06490 [Cytophagales bacterium]|nr:hypothetical protein [Cytophagales bacterium]